MITNFDIQEFNESPNNKKFELLCNYCGKSFTVKKKKISKYIHNPTSKKYCFCSLGCRIDNFLDKYIENDDNYLDKIIQKKEKNKKRSKIELFVEEKLIEYFGGLNFIFDSSNTIGYNLDIYIPSLNLGIDINGLHHYKPIFGKKAFELTQDKDKKKILECRNRGINYHTINISNQKRFTKETSQIYVDEIINIINFYLLKK